MRKRYPLSDSFIRENFELDAELAYFRVNGGESPSTIEVPSYVMRRLYRLGQAFGLQHLKYLEPDVKFAYGSVDLPRLVQDLSQLLTWVSEPQTHRYAMALVQAIGPVDASTSKFITVSSGT